MTTLAHRFQAEGFVSPVDVLPPEEAADLYQLLLTIEESLGGRLTMVLNAKAHLLVPELWDLVHDDRILDPVRSVLGPDVLCWGASFFSKDPGSAETVPLHQDCTCWGLDEAEGLTVWLAFTSSTEENGCLRVVPDTHRVSLQHVVRNAPSSMLPLGEELDAQFDDDAFVSCALTPGQMSMHHVLAVHGSSPNRSASSRRVGFAIRYIPGHRRQIGDRKGHATLVSGRDHGTFILEQRPESLMSPQALQRHRAILSNAGRIVMGEAGKLPKDVQTPG